MKGVRMVSDGTFSHVKQDPFLFSAVAAETVVPSQMKKAGKALVCFPRTKERTEILLLPK